MLMIAILVGLLYWWVNSELAPLSFPFQNPIFIGFIIGLLYGDPTQGTIIGAGIAAMYLGLFAAGNVLPSDRALAACVAIPIALASNLDAAAAIAIAVPFGVLGSFLDVFRKTLNSYWMRFGDAAIAKGNLKGLQFAAVGGPVLTQFVVRFFPVVVITYFGASYATPIIEKMPDWILHGLSVSGGLLPAIGFATCVLMVGKKNLLPYFIIGFFLVKVISMPIITTAMFAGAAAFLHLQFTHKMEEGQLRKVEENA